MTWDLINTAIALLSLFIAGALWLRTVVAENPALDVPRCETNQSRDLLYLYVRVRNPGLRALKLHRITFWSPPSDDVHVVVHGDDGSHWKGVLRGSKEVVPTSRCYALDCVVEPRAEVTVEICLSRLDRWLLARLHWSKLTPVVFPWPPRWIVRGPRKLRRLAESPSTEVI